MECIKMGLKRISKDEYYLNIAKDVSKRSTCLRRHYGSVIVKDDRIISTGYNGSPRGCLNCDEVGCLRKELNIPHGENYEICRAIHSEANAIIHATYSDMQGATLYLCGYEDNGTMIDDPDCCDMCKRMIINSGIKKVVFGNDVGVVRIVIPGEWVNELDIVKKEKEKPKKQYTFYPYTVKDIIDCFDRIMIEQKSHHHHIKSIPEKLFLINYIVSNYSVNDTAELLIDGEKFDKSDAERILKGIEEIMGDWVKETFEIFVPFKFDYDRIHTPFIERLAMHIFMLTEYYYVDTMCFKRPEPVECNPDVFTSDDYARITNIIFQYAKQVDLKAW